MTSNQISNLLQKQKEYYKSGATIPVDFRMEQLKKLYAAVKKYETTCSKMQAKPLKNRFMLDFFPCIGYNKRSLKRR